MGSPRLEQLLLHCELTLNHCLVTQSQREGDDDGRSNHLQSPECICCIHLDENAANNFSLVTKAIADRFFLNIQDHFQAAMFSLALPTAFLAETNENES